MLNIALNDKKIIDWQLIPLQLNIKIIQFMILSIFSLYFHVISSDGSRKKFLSHFPGDKGVFLATF